MRVEAIPLRRLADSWGLLRRFTPRNDGLTDFFAIPSKLTLSIE